jgi:hypothetical protein
MIEFHPLANIFPLIAAEFDAFVDDVREHGLTEKIVVHEDKILDGRNRYRALVQLGLTDEEVLRCHDGQIHDLSRRFIRCAQHPIILRHSP